MKFIGITGGVGAGKTAILSYLKQKYQAQIILADEVAHELMQPGQVCYKEIRNVFSDLSLLNDDLTFDRNKLAELIFLEDEKREKINAIVHPAVKAEILRRAEEAQRFENISYFILEAALLIQDGYDTICDELWYIYTTKENRRIRLKDSRQYTDEKIDRIFASQLPEDEYRKYCKYTIDNNGTVEASFAQIDEILQKTVKGME